MWIAVTIIGLILTPDPSGHGTHRQLGLAPCPSAFLFGRPCPGCGMTTSWTSLLHGDLAYSLRSNPFGPLLYGAFTVSAWGAAWGYARKMRFNFTPRFNRFLTIFTISFVVLSAYRFAFPPEGYSQMPFFVDSGSAITRK